MTNSITADSESTAPGDGNTVNDAQLARVGSRQTGAPESSPAQDPNWLRSLRTAMIMFLLLTGITGVVYPLLVTVIAATAFSKASAGSLIHDGPRLVGSELIGQPFDDPRYFWGRPSATAPSAFNGLAGSGSNLAPTNPALRDAVRDRVARLHDADPENRAPIPVDLVTASASGLDPHISPAAARYQAARIARLRGISLEEVHRLIRLNTAEPTLGFLGQSRVHILRLNRSLDTTTPQAGKVAP